MNDSMRASNNNNANDESDAKKIIRQRHLHNKWIFISLNPQSQNVQLQKVKFEDPLILERKDINKGSTLNNLTKNRFNETKITKKAVKGKTKPKQMTINRAEEDVWSVCDYQSLPLWLQDNDYLITSHRPPLLSFSACFWSIFRIHTETVNIWTHLLGCLIFIMLSVLFFHQPLLPLQEKLVFVPFFVGAILCMGFSFTFHTVSCHSPPIVRLFSRLDYCGIALLIIGSFIPWLYYAFYCYFWPKVIYLSIVLVLGICAIIISLSEVFGEPTYRPLRAAVFTAFGLSGMVPGLHCILIQGWDTFIMHAFPLIVTACLYILGAALYALRVPERILPGRCDIWFQSHQIFHVLVVVATFINYQGLLSVAAYQQSSILGKLCI